MRPGVLRAVTHLDLSDDDIEQRARARAAGAGSPCPRLRRSTGSSPSAQADRLPSVAAAVVRDGEIVWSNAIGAADYEAGAEAKPNTQYRIGSITKTFTATAIMQLRAEGAARPRRPARAAPRRRRERLADDPAAALPPVGVQREPGEMFVTGESPTAERADRLDGDGRVRARRRRGSTTTRTSPSRLLGQLVARKRGQPYTDVVDERIIAPLGLERTTWLPEAPKAQGYLVDEYARHRVDASRRPTSAGLAARGSCGRRSSDLCRWATFLADGHDGVLSADASRRCGSRRSCTTRDDWVLGWGLGLQLYNQRGAIYGGHGGAMAGHLAGVFIDRKTKTGAAALTNSGTRGDMELFAISLAAKALELWPAGDRGLASRAGAAGRRARDPRPLVVGGQRVRLLVAGRRRCRRRSSGRPPGRGETTFERDGDGWRAARGRERGERLRVDGDRLVWAGYAVHARPGAVQGVALSARQ